MGVGYKTVTDYLDVITQSFIKLGIENFLLIIFKSVKRKMHAFDFNIVAQAKYIWIEFELASDML